MKRTLLPTLGARSWSGRASTWEWRMRHETCLSAVGTASTMAQESRQLQHQCSSFSVPLEFLEVPFLKLLLSSQHYLLMKSWMAMKSLAIIPVSLGVKRADFIAMNQNTEEQFWTFASRVHGKAETCKFMVSHKCACGKAGLVNYTDETIQDVLLAGIADIDIRCEVLSVEVRWPLKGGSSVYATKPLTWARSGVLYTEQRPMTKENGVIMILSSLAYITPIRLSFCISTTRWSLLDRGREREREFS